MQSSAVKLVVPVLLGIAATIVACNIGDDGVGLPGTGGGRNGQPYYGPGTGSVGSGSGGIGANTTEYVYWVNNLTNDLAILAIDRASGCIAPIQSNNVSTGHGPVSVQGYPDVTKRLLYVGCVTDNIIQTYLLDANGDGNCQQASVSLSVTGGTFAQMKFRGDGAFLYVLTNNTVNSTSTGSGSSTTTTLTVPNLTSYTVDTSTGALSVPPTQAGQTVNNTCELAQPAANLVGTALAIDGDNQYAYACLNNGTVVTVQLMNNGTVQLLQQSGGSNFVSAVADPQCLVTYQGYIYEGSSTSSSLDFLQSVQGLLTVNQSTYPTGGQDPVGLYVPQGGASLFTANDQSGDVSEFTLTASNGVLGPQPIPPPPPTQLATWNTMTNALAKSTNLMALAINFTGTFLYTLDNGVNSNPPVPAEITCFTLTGTNGTMVLATAPTYTLASGTPFNFFQIQNAGSPGLQPVTTPNIGALGLCPDTIITYHID
jgi:6-phosphogluconolactonase (cycloisomerase 2 family)